MKTYTKTIVYLLAGCVLSTVTRAAVVDSRDHPYKAISAANVFRLKTPALPPDHSEPTPKIKLQGITTITARRQALFNVMLTAKPPDSAKEISHVLSEGERVGEIEVLEINVQSGTVKFSNHGVVQVLALK